MRRLHLPSWAYTGGWLLLGLLAVVLEATALVNAEPGDTLTEMLRPAIASHPAVWFATLGLAVWAVRHLWCRRP